MNKIAKNLTIICIMGAVLVGCGPKVQDEDNGQSVAGENNIDSDSQDNSKGRQRSDGQDLNRKGRLGSQEGFSLADFVGEVVSVTGSEVTLKIIEIPIMEGEPRQRRGTKLQEGYGEGNDVDVAQPPSQGDNDVEMVKPPYEDKNQGKRFEQEEPPQGSLNYTGETKTIIIPEGIAIIKTEMSESGMEDKDIKLEELKQGDILQVWYSEEDSEVISKISVGKFGFGGRR